MTKRYYKRTYADEYYIFDSTIITEKEFSEKLELQGYKAFEDSLTSKEIVELLNQNDKLKRLLLQFYTLEELEGELIWIKNAENT